MNKDLIALQSAGVTDEQLIACAKASTPFPAGMDAQHIAEFLPTWRKFADAILALAPGLSGWVSVAERMPDTDAEVLVWTAQGAMLDRWRMQSEAPLSFSSATIETGMYWDNHEFEEITHWQPITAPGIAPHQPQPEPTSKGEPVSEEIAAMLGERVAFLRDPAVYRGKYWDSMTNEQRKQAFTKLDGGAAGYAKKFWTWRHFDMAAEDIGVREPQEAAEVTEFNVGRYCLSEDDCIAEGLHFGAYERGVEDAAKAFGRNRRG